MSIIQVEDVSMRFNLAQEKTETLKEYTVKLLKHQLFFNEFYALRDISFKIEPGESMAPNLASTFFRFGAAPCL